MKQSNPYIILHTKWTSIFVSSIKFLQLNGYDLLATVRHFFIQTFFFRFFSPQIARPSINYITIETRNWKFHNFYQLKIMTFSLSRCKVNRFVIDIHFKSINGQINVKLICFSHLAWISLDWWHLTEMFVGFFINPLVLICAISGIRHA